MTNADRIRAMTDEELAGFINDMRFEMLQKIADAFGADITEQIAEGKKQILETLEQDIEDLD